MFPPRVPFVDIKLLRNQKIAPISQQVLGLIWLLRHWIPWDSTTAQTDQPNAGSRYPCCRCGQICSVEDIRADIEDEEGDAAAAEQAGILKACTAAPGVRPAAWDSREVALFSSESHLECPSFGQRRRCSSTLSSFMFIGGASFYSATIFWQIE